MTNLRQRLRPIVLAIAMAFPASAVAQHVPTQPAGQVTVTHYNNSCYEDFLCVDASIGVFRTASGTFFGQLLHFDTSFDAEGYEEWRNEGAPFPTKFLGYDIQYSYLEYAELFADDPTGGFWYFINPEREDIELFTTPEYSQEMIPGRFTVGFTRWDLEDFPGGDGEFGTGLSVTLEPLSVDRFTTTPEPGTILLVASGLIALGGVTRRRRRHEDSID